MLLFPNFILEEFGVWNAGFPIGQKNNSLEIFGWDYSNEIFVWPNSTSLFIIGKTN